MLLSKGREHEQKACSRKRKSLPLNSCASFCICTPFNNAQQLSPQSTAPVITQPLRKSVRRYKFVNLLCLSTSSFILFISVKSSPRQLKAKHRTASNFSPPSLPLPSAPQFSSSRLLTTNHKQQLPCCTQEWIFSGATYPHHQQSSPQELMGTSLMIFRHCELLAMRSSCRT